MKELKYVGKSLLREDAVDKVTGAVRYTGDLCEKDQLYGRLVLSEKPAAKIKIDSSEALKIPGITAVYTYEDVPKIKYNSHLWSPAVDGPMDQYILSDRARYTGDHLALVTGTSKEAVDEAVRQIRVEYVQEEPVLTCKQAEERKDLVDFEKTVVYGDYEQEEKKADMVVHSHGTTPKVHHGAIEPHVVFCMPDEEGNLIVKTPCQTVYQVRYHIHQLLGLPYSRIRVIKSVMGGSFGGKGQTVLEPACAFAAWKQKRPVLLSMTREDAVTGTRTRNPVEMDIWTAVSKEGKILGRKIECSVNGGAYYTNSSAVVMAMAKKLCRMYRMNAQKIHAKAYRTNTTPGGACRGYGSPQGHALTEVNLDFTARALKMDPCEFRLKNLIHSYDEDPTGGTNLGNAQIQQCVRRGREEFCWDERRKKVHEKNTDRYVYGVGMACGAHGNGYYGAYPELTEVEMHLEQDGRLEIKIGIHDQGCGTVLTMQQIAAEATGIHPSDITVKEADTFLSPYDSAGTQASRVTYFCGGAVEEAGKRLREQIILYCHEAYGWEKEKIKIEDSKICYEKERKSLSELVLEYENKKECTFSVFYKHKGNSNPGSYSACFAEVKIDRYTGLVSVEDFLAVHDIGQVMNRMLAEGQVAGGAQMSIGMALYEQIEIGADGSVKNQNFSKYHMINAPSMPKVWALFIEEHGDDGPYGGKSLGEIAAVAPAPAVVNAINHALGSSFSDFPVTPEKIIEFEELRRQKL